MDEEFDRITDAATILAAGTALARATELDPEDAFVLVPKGYKVHDLEPFHAAPRRKRGTVGLHETASFVQYVLTHKDADSLVFCDRKAAKFTAVLDAHKRDAARWQEHRAVLTLQRTPEWQTWVEHNKRQMDQVGFAEFIESNIFDISDPVGAVLLEMVVALEERRNVTFQSAIKLESGHRQFTYAEEGKPTGGRGQVQIPSTIKLELAPFYGAPEKSLNVLLRYRMNSGVVKFWYEMPRVEEVEREAVEGAAKEIGEKVETTVLYGAVGNG